MGEDDLICVVLVDRVNSEVQSPDDEEIPSASVDEASQALDWSRTEQRARRDAESIGADAVFVDWRIVREETLAERLACLDEEDRQRQEAVGPGDAPGAAAPINHGNLIRLLSRLCFAVPRAPCGKILTRSTKLDVERAPRETRLFGIPYLDNDNGIAHGYSEIAGGGKAWGNLLCM